MIRQATVNDLEKLIPMGFKFAEESKLPGKFVPEVWLRNWTNFLSQGVGVVLLSEREGSATGAIAGLMYNDLNDDARILAETFWFTDHNYRGLDGLKLFYAFEGWAKRNGVERLHMAHLSEINAETLRKLYLRRGYISAETFYIKTL
jgi:hypothetical protein